VTTGFPVGVATGVGSWPGTDAREAAATIVGELPGLAHLVELPARGVGADMIGRSSALLVDLSLDTTVRGYRLGTRAGSVSRRAHDLLRTDLDAMEWAWESAGLAGTGRVVKVQAPGPFTLAAQVELANGHRGSTDAGAVRELAESLAEGVAAHVAEVGARLRADVVLQLDEPTLSDVLDGALSGPSKWHTVRAVPEPEALSVLDTVTEAQSVPTLLHSCAGRPALGLLRQCSAPVVGFDPATIGSAQFDAVAEIIDTGKQLVFGAVPAAAPTKPLTWREIAAPCVRLIDVLGFGRSVLRRISVSPADGLADAPLSWAREALRLADEVAHKFIEDAETLPPRAESAGAQW